MNYRYLGKTGLKVSELCLGSMSFGRETSEEISHQMLDRFVDIGGNFIDTADVYTAPNKGIAEEIIGRWLKGKPRDDFVIATKLRFAMGGGPNQTGLSRKHILAAVEASLRRLNTDYIDLYQVHCWDRGAPLQETLSTLDGLVQSGKVRYLGASNFSGWQLQKAVDLSRHMGWEPFVCLQAQYNLLCRTTEWELVPVCQSEGLGLLCYSPLQSGWLSGRYRRGMTGAPQESRLQFREERGLPGAWGNQSNEFTWNLLDVLFAVAEEMGKTPAQAAINWLLQRSGVTVPIIGMRNLAQMEDNLGASGWSLSAEQMTLLNEASELLLPYPYEYITRLQRGR